MSFKSKMEELFKGRNTQKQCEGESVKKDTDNWELTPCLWMSQTWKERHLKSTAILSKEIEEVACLYNQAKDPFDIVKAIKTAALHYPKMSEAEQHLIYMFDPTLVWHINQKTTSEYMKSLDNLSKKGGEKERSGNAKPFVEFLRIKGLFSPESNSDSNEPVVEDSEPEMPETNEINLKQAVVAEDAIVISVNDSKSKEKESEIENNKSEENIIVEEKASEPAEEKFTIVEESKTETVFANVTVDDPSKTNVEVNATIKSEEPADESIDDKSIVEETESEPASESEIEVEETEKKEEEQSKETKSPIETKVEETKVEVEEKVITETNVEVEPVAETSVDETKPSSEENIFVDEVKEPATFVERKINPKTKKHVKRQNKSSKN